MSEDTEQPGPEPAAGTPEAATPASTEATRHPSRPAGSWQSG